MPSQSVIYRAAVCLLWALALWHAWVCRGLFVDGSAFMSQIAVYEWFFAFYPPRVYAMVLGQIPVMLGMKLGVTDLHWLSRLLSLGLFGLPTIFYHAALARARHDPVLLAIVLAAIGVVFFTTSFFIVGEYNTLYGMMMLVAVMLATTDRLNVRDGIVLLLIGILALRTYEAAVYLAPIVAPMILWRVWSMRMRPPLVALLYVGAAVGIAGGFVIALQSILVPWNADHRNDALHTILNFWQNMQFMFALAGVATLAVWALIRPADLATARPYLWAAMWALLLALTPLLGFVDGQIRPLAKSQYVARTMGGGLIAAMIVTIWVYSSDAGRGLDVMRVVRTPIAGRNLLALGAALFLAVLPSDLYLTATWSRYLEVFRDTVQSRNGLIPYEETALAKRPHILFVENWTIPMASLVLRSKREDGIILTPLGYTEWQPFNPAESHPDLGRYFWRR
jgi:hypothetical protein